MPLQVGFMANPSRPAALDCAAELARWMAQTGASVRLQREVAEHYPGDQAPGEVVEEEELGRGDCLVAVGGDGTLLAATRVAEPHGTPILGVHAGGPASFGFMTETTPALAREAFERLLRGDYHINERLMVACRVRRGGETVGEFSALNELVISKAALARMLRMRIWVEETFIATYGADGIIVATPTGSTAYNLAAGGPLVHPTVQVILLTPICPHTLNVRSLIVGDREMIQVQIETDRRDEALLTVDGQVGFELEPGDRVEFYRAPHSARMIALDGASFYQKLHTRLGLGERF